MTFFISFFVWFILPLIVAYAGYLILEHACMDWGIVLEAIGVVVFVMVVFACPINRTDMSSKVRAIEQVRTTISEARKVGNQAELAALQTKIIEYNAKLASVKYFADCTILRVFYPEDIYTTEYLK